MQVDVYTICWNEADMLGFFFRHYDELATRYIVYDDGSTDGSLDILRDHPKVEVRRFPRVIQDSFVLSHAEFHNSVWKESRGAADWVLLTAIDEHLDHKSLPDYLGRCRKAGITMMPAVGFQMVSDEFPGTGETLSQSRVFGCPFGQMNKLAVFNPTALRETNFDPGRHTGEPAGDIVIPEHDQLMNLHYKYLGFDRIYERHKLLATGLGPGDRQRSYGHRYSFGRDELRVDFDSFKSRAMDIRPLRDDPAKMAGDGGWWRDPSRGYETRPA
jgi:hypothetical protein